MPVNLLMAPPSWLVWEAVARLREGEAANVCSISAALLKTGGAAIILVMALKALEEEAKPLGFQIFSKLSTSQWPDAFLRVGK